MDRIDSAYYAHSSRIDLTEETRVNATNDEAEEWRKQNEATSSRARSIPANRVLFVDLLARSTTKLHIGHILSDTCGQPHWSNEARE